ncbi:hypothetical protein DPMN_039157 [Dreissena polymorpha]|uniref:Ig-like domain-containing protein n=2 Tax=Dreissena polymorpha TaxID=45954 RepID=A0A9D4MID4_DREPO|nr:hypothetical protein DPMN_039157 [Dreissena polymorpha]
MHAKIIFWMLFIVYYSFSLEVKLTKKIASPTRLKLTCFWSYTQANLVAFYRSSNDNKFQNALQIVKPDRGCEVRTALEANCTCGNGTYVDCYINVNQGLVAVDQWMCSVPENGSLYSSNTVIVRKDDYGDVHTDEHSKQHDPATVVKFAVETFEGLSNVSLKENSTVIFHCVGNGSPTLFIRIVKDEQILEECRDDNDISSSGEIHHVISPVSSQHSGEYKCVAYNNHGESERFIYLDILYPVRMFQNQFTKNKTIIPLLEDFALTFHTIGNPLPDSSNFTWLKNQNPDTREDNSTVLRWVIETNGADYNVSISNIQKGDYGMYVFQVSNGVGEPFRMVYVLEEFIPPNVLPLDPVYISEGESVNTSCKYEHGNPQDTNIRLIKDNITISNGTLFIEKASKRDRGIYTCEATNTISESKMNFTGIDRELFNVYILYPATVHNFCVKQFEGVQNVTLSENDAATLHCIGEGYPVPLMRIMRGNTQLVELHGNDSKNNTIEFVHNMSVVTCDDFGNYSCVALNKFALSGKELHLNVICPVRKIKSEPNDNQRNEANVPLNGEVTFRFHASSNPLPKRSDFSWRKCMDTKECIDIVPNDRVKLETYGASCNLTINNITEADYGMYILQVSNGLDKMHTEVYLLKRPYSASTNVTLIIIVSATGVGVLLTIAFAACLNKMCCRRSARSALVGFPMVDLINTTDIARAAVRNEQTFPKYRPGDSMVYYEIRPPEDPIVLADVSFGDDVPEYPTATADHGRYESLIRTGQDDVLQYTSLTSGPNN